MSEQERNLDAAPDASEPGSQQSRFIPGGLIEAGEIQATNVANVQHIAQQHIHLAGQRYVPPLQLPRRAEHFQDRESERAWLLAHLRPGQIVTLCGPGGMGKTALVAEVLWSLAPDGTPPASFPHGIVFHSFYGRPEAAVALEQLARSFGEDPLPTPAQAAQRALSGKQAVLVLDGVEEAEHLEQVLAVCASCAVLVTSRRRSDAADPAALLDLQRLPLTEAVTVVQAWQAQRQTNAAVIERICQQVGGLPLALRLVGSYLALHPDEAEDYLAWLEEDVWQALEQGSSTHKSVPRLLTRSVACVSAEAQAALGVIGLLALAPFARELVTDVLDVPARAARRALAELVDYGLLVPLGTAYEVSHPLIHTYARHLLAERSDAVQRHAMLTRLVTALAAHFPEVEPGTWADCERLVPHIQACATQMEPQQEGLAEAASLFILAGDYLLERGRYEQAEELYGRALAIREQVLEPEHADLALSLDRLATIYQYRGKYGQAEPLFQRAIAIDEKTLSPEHPDLATSYNNLASLYSDQGRYEEAASLYQRAVAIGEQSLGTEHSTLADYYGNLALLYKDQGRYQEAEPLYQRAIAIAEKVLDSEHPDLATFYNALAGLYRSQGRYQEAEPLYQRAIAIAEKTLGPEHPDLATHYNNLANLYTDQERYQEAESLLQRAIAIEEKTLGPEHPETATTLYSLAYLCQKQGRYQEAESLYQRALAIKEHTLAPDHPSIANILFHYALLLRAMNRPREAQMLEQRASAIRARRASGNTP